MKWEMTHNQSSLMNHSEILEKEKAEPLGLTKASPCYKVNRLHGTILNHILCIKNYILAGGPAGR